MGNRRIPRDRDGFSRGDLMGEEWRNPHGVSQVARKGCKQFPECVPPPHASPCPVRSPAHLEADAHVRGHDDLVAFAVHLCAPQELTLGCSDVVVAAVVAKLNALLQHQKHTLCHVLIGRLRWIAEEPFRDFLCGQNMQKRAGDFCACSVDRSKRQSRSRGLEVGLVD